MIPQVVLHNFQSWMTQVFLIASVGAVLPWAFRICHPRSQLVYCHFVLLLCLALPVLQSWHHPVVFLGEAQQTASHSTESVVSASPEAQTRVPWEQLMILLVVSGTIARLSWTFLGLLRIHRHRLAAAPLYPVPEIVEDASTRIGASATFCVSAGGLGPLTFGFIRPVVLMPKSLFSMSDAAQRGVLCHELLHVKRRDWLITVAEETVAALFWFHPAVWWLLGQARLSREQLVDAEVVRAISDREPYIDALLSMSGVQRGLDLVPAPLFLRRRHLLKRMRFLVSEISMSKARLLSSYTLIAGILSTAAWLNFVSFPMVGHAEVRQAVGAEAQSQNPPGYVVNIQPRSYPQEAIDRKIQGTVVVELAFNAAGNIIDSHVISGPEELRKAALESALNGIYSINVARTLQVVVPFSLANAKPERQVLNFIDQARTFSVLPSGTNTVEKIEIVGLSEQTLAETNLRQKLLRFQGQQYSAELRREIQQVVNAESSLIGTGPFGAFSMSLSKGSADGRVVLQLNFDRTMFQTPFGPAANDASVHTPFGEVPTSPAIQPISKVDPTYPPLALQTRIQGVVVMFATIDTEGKVQNVRVLSGHPLLVQAAIDAVGQWVFPPQTVSTNTTVTVNFAFPH